VWSRVSIKYGNYSSDPCDLNVNSRILSICGSVSKLV